MSQRSLALIGGNATPALTDDIARELSVQRTEARVGRFPDGEIDAQIEANVRGADVFLVQSTCPPVNDNLVELLILIDAARRASATRITAVIPYFGYARKDRKDEGRVPITAKLVANMLTVAGVDRILTVDLHAAQIQGFFDLPVDHLYAAPVLVRHFLNQRLENLTVVAPDVGSSKMARGYANRLGGELAIVDKRRVSGKDVEVGAVIGDVEDRNVLLIDDMISTAGSITEAAKVCHERGARSVRIAASHGVLCGPARERLRTAPVEEIVLTDTIPVDPTGLPTLNVLRIAPLLAEAIMRVHTEQSLSVLFTRSDR
ncbi:MAG: ribose-phosphate pyrophosphokinase [Planctomycetota bacterium]|nr:ribose-phosphate pyrophosphokinase [Planctomycetota bacterium]